jgi:peroxiredoxin
MNATTEPSRSYVRLAPGDPAPWFHQRSTSNPNYAFDTAAGRYIVLCFFGSAAMRSVVPRWKVCWPTVNNSTTSGSAFFGVSLDPGDETEGRVREALPVYVFSGMQMAP